MGNWDFEINADPSASAGSRRKQPPVPRLASGLCLLFLLSAGTPAASQQTPGLGIEGRVREMIEWSGLNTLTATDSALAVAHRAVELAGSEGDEKLVVEAYLGLGYAFFRLGVPDSATAAYGQALQVSQQAGYLMGEGMALNRLGNAEWAMGDQTQGVRYFQQALEIHRRLGDEREIGRALLNLANVSREWGEYQRAIEFYLEAREHYEEIEYTEGIAWLDFSLSILYKELGEYDQALETINASLDGYRKVEPSSPDSTGVMICYGQLGDIHTLMGQLEEGLRFHMRALELRQATGVKPAIADGLTGVGKTYYEMGDLQEALDYFQRAQSVREETGVLRGMSTNLRYLGAIHRDLGQTDSALVFLNRGLEVSRELTDRAAESALLEMMAGIHAGEGRFEEAWRLFQEHREVQDRVMNAEISKRVASVELRHQLEQQEAEYQGLQAENRIQELRLAESRGQLMLLIVLLAFAATGVVVLAYLHRKRQQIRTLKGLIPICAHCKKIRNDEGYFEQLEQYLSTHSEARFSHGICEECAKEHFDIDLHHSTP